MNTAANQLPGGDREQQSTTPEKEVQISQPQVERAEGPFEHSGETSGWTEEEKAETEQKPD